MHVEFDGNRESRCTWELRHCGESCAAVFWPTKGQWRGDFAALGAGVVSQTNASTLAEIDDLMAPVAWRPSC